MNSSLVFLLLAGSVAGLGVFLLIRALAPVQTELADGLARLDAQTVLSQTGSLPGLPVRTQDSGPLTRILTRASGRLAGLRITVPQADLQILGWTREQYVGLRVLAPLLGLAFGPLLGLLCWLAGIRLPWMVSALESVALAGLIWWYVGRYVTGKAQDARLEMRYALVSYINVVALHRAAGAGIVEALEDAASVAESWAYRQIANQLDHSARAGQQPWEGLADLARTLDIKELADIGSIAGISGIEGASVFDTLLARAGSLRGQLLTEEKTQATESSTKMTYPQTVLAAVVMAFLLFPALMRLLGG